MRKTKINLIVIVLIGLFTLSTLTSAMTISEDKSGVQAPLLVTQIAEFHISKIPAYENCQVSAYYPVYNAAGDMIMYYEAKVIDSTGSPKGYIMLSSDKHDYPIVEFTTEGLTNYELFSNKIAGDFKMIRFGPGYVAAQDADGKLLAEEGSRPIIMTEEIKAALNQSWGEEKFVAEGHGDNIPLIETIQNEELEQLLGNIDLNSEDYYTRLRSNFDQQFLPDDLKAVSDKWEAYNKEMTEISTAWPWTYHEYWANGTFTHFSQIAPNQSPNNKGYYTGCGATAWMNLYGVFDVSGWSSNILSGNQYYNNNYIKNLTVQISNRLGTWHSFSNMGATWPWNMNKGLQYANDTLNHRSSNWYRWGSPLFSGVWVYPVVRSAIKNNDTPCIVGYLNDVHYEIADGIYESSLSPWLDSSWIHVRKGSSGKWIEQTNLFGAWTVYNFYQN